MAGLARSRSQSKGLVVEFARVSLATSIPDALTTMLVEAGLACLLFARIVAPSAVLAWLSGPGLPFMTAYQLIGTLWIVGLMAAVVRVRLDLEWRWSLPVGLGLTVLYGIPIGLLIR